MKTWLKVTLGIFVFLFLIGIFSSFFNNSDTTYQSGNVVEDKKVEQQTTEPLKILEHQKEYGEYGSLIITGIAENIGDKQLSYAEIRVKFYDKDGALISNSFDNINDLNAGEKWKFKVMYLGLDDYEVDRYEIAVGSVW